MQQKHEAIHQYDPNDPMSQSFRDPAGRPYTAIRGDLFNTVIISDSLGDYWGPYWGHAGRLYSERLYSERLYSERLYSERLYSETVQREYTARLYSVTIQRDYTETTRDHISRTTDIIQ
jgi:hypothetical protein